MKTSNLLLLCLCLLTLSVSASAINVTYKGSNVTVYTGLPYAQTEFDNPLTSTEMVAGHKIAEWRDAGYFPGSASPYQDWTVSGSGTFWGDNNELYMTAPGQGANTTTTVAGTTVSVHLNGDSNDGIAQILVDGVTVATIEMYNPDPPTTCIVVVNDLPNTTHTIRVEDQGAVPGQNGTDIAVLGAAVLSEKSKKWSQQPVPGTPGNLFYGWNEQSTYSGRQIAADDWLCSDPNPITGIRWWGSFVNWKQCTPPTNIVAFDIAIWTDVPASVDGFSHPGTCVWQSRFNNYSSNWVGWDFDPKTQSYEACFEYDLDIPQDKWFHQAEGNNIYWISIAAVDQTGTQYPWGWKTRPRDPSSTAPDAAVKIFNPTTPIVGSTWVSGDPILWPSSQDKWDLAFELNAKDTQPILKWDQPPVKDAQQQIVGWDEKSAYGLGEICADDWLCSNPQPVTNITWWGSYKGWRENKAPQDAPMEYQVGIWTNQPVGPFPWPTPKQMVWEYRVPRAALSETYVGMDAYGGMTPEACYKYSLTIPQDKWFNQGPTNNIFWLSVAAIYSGTPVYMWGWTTRPYSWGGNAIGMTAPPAPVPGDMYNSGNLIKSSAGAPMDLTFQIGTQPTMQDYKKWSQPPAPYTPPAAFNGWDEESMYGGKQIVADDWHCTDNRRVNGIRWWGSFKNWGQPNPPTMPDAFHIAIWKDVPSGPQNPFSHPDNVIWEDTCDNYTWTYAGIDVDPRDPCKAPEACFEFYQDFPDSNWFKQQGPDNVYWVSIAAIYREPMGIVWGWLTRPHFYNDDAVRIFDPLSPVLGDYYKAGEPIFWPAPEQSWDTAFELVAEDLKPGTLTLKMDKTIPDHFWYPSPDPDNEMIDFGIWASPDEDIKWDSVTLHAWGSGNDQTDILNIKVWQDNNNDGVVDPLDTLLGTGTYPVNDGTIIIPVTGPIVPAGSHKDALISYTMSAAGTTGSTYGFDITGAAGTGQTTGLPAIISLSPSPLVSAKKIRAPKPVKIGEAKKDTSGLDLLLIDKVITADYRIAFGLAYIEEPDRTSGIGVAAPPAAVFNIGDKVSLLGTTSLLSGSELIFNPLEGIVTPATETITPLGMNNKWTGGGVFGGQPAVYDDASPLGVPKKSVVLNNVGSLIRTWGKVTHFSPSFTMPTLTGDICWIDDGSALVDGFEWFPGKPCQGIAVLWPSGMFVPVPGQVIGVTGIMRAVPNTGSLPIRLLVPRNSVDIQSFWP